MVNVIKDPNTGRKIAEIRDETNLTVMRDAHGGRLGTFDGKVTRDAKGRKVGDGNLLTSMLDWFLS